MTLVRWNPFADMVRLQDDIECLLHRDDSCGQCEPLWLPAVTIEESESAVMLHLEVPGIKPEEVEITLDGDFLTVRSEQKTEHADKQQHVIYSEHTARSFMRVFTIGTPIHAEGVTATYRDGILDITLPKAEDAKPKHIQVQMPPAA